jgi:hypothetical protein
MRACERGTDEKTAEKCELPVRVGEEGDCGCCCCCARDERPTATGAKLPANCGTDLPRLDGRLQHLPKLCAQRESAGSSVLYCAIRVQFGSALVRRAHALQTAESATNSLCKNTHTHTHTYRKFYTGSDTSTFLVVALTLTPKERRLICWLPGQQQILPLLSSHPHPFHLRPHHNYPAVSIAVYCTLSGSNKKQKLKTIKKNQ